MLGFVELGYLKSPRLALPVCYLHLVNSQRAEVDIKRLRYLS